MQSEELKETHGREKIRRFWKHFLYLKLQGGMQVYSWLHRDDLC